MIYILLSLLSKRQTKIICKQKFFLPISAITNNIKLYYQLIFKKIKETIKEKIKYILKKRCFIYNKEDY